MYSAISLCSKFFNSSLPITANETVESFRYFMQRRLVPCLIECIEVKEEQVSEYLVRPRLDESYELADAMIEAKSAVIKTNMKKSIVQVIKTQSFEQGFFMLCTEKFSQIARKMLESYFFSGISKK